jgi:hypothetical protein
MSFDFGSWLSSGGLPALRCGNSPYRLSSATHPLTARSRDDRFMTEQNQAVISRLSAEFNSLSSQFARVSGDLTELHTVLAALEAPATEPDVPENDAAAEQPAAAEKPNQPQPQPRPEPQPGPRAATQYGPRTAPQGPASPWSHSAPDPRAYLSRPAMGGPQRAPYPSWMQPVAAGRPVGPGQPVGPYAPGARPLLPTPPGAGGRGPVAAAARSAHRHRRNPLCGSV